ncbi:hypothetical protein F5888DRAFT_1908746 [Russula emetica]|nr:hypothetical protein F5888DRAFT_1908746 [Russula emetica]
MGVERRVDQVSPQPTEDIGNEGVLEAGSFYAFRIPEGINDNNFLARAIHMDVINTRSTPQTLDVCSDAQMAEDRQLFREALEERDVCCIMTALEENQASHIIPHAHGNAWIDVIVDSRPNYYEDVTTLTFNDVRNGVLTPNPVLNMDDVRRNIQRQIRAGTGYHEGERFTLQLIEISDAIGRSTVEQFCQVGRDAMFSSHTDTAKPSSLLLHYNYGAAVVKWWGHHTEMLRS